MEDNDAVDNQRDNSGKFVKGNTVGFKPGQSGNPDGRPPKEKILSYWLYEDMLHIPTMEEDGVDGKGQSIGQIIARRANREAMAGSYQHLQEIFNRIEGKVTQPIDTGESQVRFDVLHLRAEKDYIKGLEAKIAQLEALNDNKTPAEEE